MRWRVVSIEKRFSRDLSFRTQDWLDVYAMRVAR